MENLISRYRNVTILAVMLFVQVLGLAVQVKRGGGGESTRLIRSWTVSAVTPLEKIIIWCQGGLGNLWNNYVYLRGVRQENRDLKFEIEQLRLDQVRLIDDAQQARRLQALLGFKEQYIAKTVAAQVIGSSGSEQSRSIYIDKGSVDGVEKDMAVITADGVVGKVLRAFRATSQVLLINDQSSGVGAILDKSRLQGVVKGTSLGEVILENVMTDESVGPGERVATSGGDQIFPKGLTVGTVMKVSPGADLFLNIRLKPSANLNRLEEVLVITKKEDRAPSVADSGRVRAVDILTQRLPSVPDRPAVEPPGATIAPGSVGTAPAASPKPRNEVSGTPPADNLSSGSPSPANPPGSNAEGRAAARAATPQKRIPARKKASGQVINPGSTESAPNDPAKAKPDAPEEQPH
jgi:rod shape-determining protein MreC